jgi:hypothetical protein
VFDRVAVGVEEGGIPVAEGLVSFGAVEWQADVASGDYELGVLSGHHHHGCHGVRVVVTSACLGHVDDGGVGKAKRADLNLPIGYLFTHLICLLTSCSDGIDHRGAETVVF